MSSLPGRRGQVLSTAPSPLPQEEARGGAKPVRLTHAFTQFLPPRSFVFFQRAYFRSYPRPLQYGGKAPFPVPIPLMKIQVPPQQGLVFQRSVFKVYESSGVGTDDVVEVEAGRTVGTFGFSTEIGSRGLVDFSSNLTANGDPVVWNPAQTLTPTQPPQVGAGRIYPFSGNAQQGLENFASYAQPGQEIICTAWVLRAPPFDTRQFSVEISGYLVGWVQLQEVLDKLAK